VSFYILPFSGGTLPRSNATPCDNVWLEYVDYRFWLSSQGERRRKDAENRCLQLEFILHGHKFKNLTECQNAREVKYPNAMENQCFGKWFEQHVHEDKEIQMWLSGSKVLPYSCV
jgi:cupin superfamily acireductone dioxygenase involved in methionine salvage